MTRIFRLYFGRSLPGAAALMGTALLAVLVLPPLKLVVERSTVLYFALVVLLPTLAVILGSLNGAETASEAREEAELALPVSSFGRLLGAALASLAVVALAWLLLVLVLTVLEEDAGLAGVRASLGIGAYLLALLQACAYAFVFGRLSRSLMAGAAAGTIVSLLTTMGILASTAVDAWIVGDPHGAGAKAALFILAGLASLYSLKYVGALGDRKERPSPRNVGAVALLLSAGLLFAGLLLAVSKARAHKILTQARAGDKAFANFIYAKAERDGAYKLYENPVKGELALAGPDGGLRALRSGKVKSFAEFLGSPMYFSTEASWVGPDGEVWVITREPGYPLYHAAPGGGLELSASLGIKDRPLLTMFEAGGKTWLARAEGFGDGLHYLARLTPGEPVKWELAGQTKKAAWEAVVRIKKASGRYAWLSGDRRTLLAARAGKETPVCRLPYKGAPFYHTPLYRAVRAGGKDLFFVPLMKDGRTALYYCGDGRAAAPAWGGPEGLGLEFLSNHDGSAFAARSRRVNGGDEWRVFYVVSDSGELLPPLDADRVFAGRKFGWALPVKASGKEIFFLLDGRELVKTDGAGFSSVAKLDGRQANAAAVAAGIIFRNSSGLRLAGWDGKVSPLN